MKGVRGNDLIKGWSFIRESSNKSLESLVTVHSLSYQADLVEAYMNQFLALFENCTTWTKHSHELVLFNSVIRMTHTRSQSTYLNRVIEIIRTSSSVEKDSEVRTTTILLLNFVFGKVQIDGEAVNRVLESTLIPCLIWKSGEKASVLRSYALDSIHTIFLNKSHVDSVTEAGVKCTITSLLGNIDDDLSTSRTFCLKILNLLLLNHALDGHSSFIAIDVRTNDETRIPRTIKTNERRTEPNKDPHIKHHSSVL